MTSSIQADKLFRVDGLVAVVTGGGTGIGLMIAKALEENGAKVYIIGRREEVLNKASKEAKNGNIVPVVGDVTSKADLERIVSQIQSSDGFINLLVANSGITGPGLSGLTAESSLTEVRETLWKTSFEDFTQTYNVNASAVFFTAIAFLELLDAGNKKGNVEQKSQIIATASVGAFNRVPLAGYAYSSSKAAVVHLVKQFATSFVPHNIRANALAPGLYPSEMAAPAIDHYDDKKWPKSVVPLQRAGTIEDMAGAILFLVSRAGAYLNGNILVTDGGRLSVVPSAY